MRVWRLGGAQGNDGFPHKEEVEDCGRPVLRVMIARVRSVKGAPG
jgi:hypothetical protein